MTAFLGIDVGTGSARAGLFDPHGKLLAHSLRPIRMWRPRERFVEQSSDDIWEAICQCVQEALAASGVEPADVAGIGFDATCSLVVLDEAGKPLTVSPDGDAQQNVIVWMDHRAAEIAADINEFSEENVLRYVGGKISPEMEVPKLLWLKRNLPETWQRAAHFFDLPDYLSYRATGSFSRSLCSTVCKWTYLAHEAKKEGAQDVEGWDGEFLSKIGLEDLVTEDFRRIGTEIRAMGEPVGHGLSEQAALELGLAAGIPVGASLIDAHAGGVGMIGAVTGDSEAGGDFDNVLALIGGTSSCHMAVSAEARFIPGVWGPYFGAMLPGVWLNEGGQSATGALVDQIVLNSGASAQLLEQAELTGESPYAWLNQRLAQLAGEEPVSQLTRQLHVCPYFHGNRSPRANPDLVGMISGLHLSETLDDLALRYLATVQAIAYGTRHIIEAMNAAGYRIHTIVACGGGTKNPLFLQQHADITGCRIVLPQEPEAVLLGAAILGACASGQFATLEEAMAQMTHVGHAIEPTQSTTEREFHERKFQVFHQLYEDQLRYEAIMNGAK